MEWTVVSLVWQCFVAEVEMRQQMGFRGFKIVMKTQNFILQEWVGRVVSLKQVSVYTYYRSINTCKLFEPPDSSNELCLDDKLPDHPQ